MQNLKSQVKNKVRRFVRRKNKINVAIKSANPDFRVVINKSNLYIKAQVIDKEGNVVASIIDKVSKATTKVLRAEEAAQQLAKTMIDKGIKKATFDRNGHLYHGRVKAFADGMRKGGVEI